MDFTKICRLCCEKKFRMQSIFEKNQSFPLKILFDDVLRLQVYPEDGLPQNVCKFCVASLMKIHETIENFRANDLMLRKQLVGVEIKEEEEEMETEALEETFAQELELVKPIVPNEKTDAAEQDVKEEQKGDLVSDSESADVMDQNEESESDEDSADCIQRTKSRRGKRNPRRITDPNDMDHWRRNDHLLEQAEAQLKEYRKQTPLKVEGTPQKTPQRRRRDPNIPRLKDYKCYICNSDPLGSPEALLAHLHSHSDELPYTCTICVTETVTINNLSTLNIHKRMHENPFKCSQCDRRYSSKYAVLLHVQSYHEQETITATCEYCGKVYPSKQSMLYHLKKHTEAVPCEYCGKAFVEKHKLRLHIQRKHEKIKLHECYLCHKKLSGLDALHVHIRIMHSTQEFECQYCSKKYPSELSLRYHLKRHESNPNYKGPNDWKQYYTFIEGEEGMRDGVRLKKCSLCGVITRGIGAHLGAVHFPTEHRCEQCGLTFKRKGAYDVHILEHERGKAFRCPICGREFSERKNLIVHMRTKKHRDHPLAKSLDWLYSERKLALEHAALNKKKENKRVDEMVEEYLVDEIEVGTDNVM